jgi:membrane associated rhomboid family serine protease
MVPAAVGFQCPECVRAGTRATRQNQGPYGGAQSRNPRQTSIILIVVNAIVWAVLQVAQLAGLQYRIVWFLGLLPRGVCSSVTEPGSYWPAVSKVLCRANAGGTWIPGVVDGAWWQVFTSIFTHVSILHIAMNCLTLWFLGPPLESWLGRTRFLTTYLVAGLFGSLAVYCLSAEQSLSYGGSGSLFGLMGALLIILWRQKADVRQLLLWLGLNIVVTFVGASISWQAHMGGLVGGVLLAGVWVFVPSSAHRDRVQWGLVGVLGVVLVVGFAARTLVLLG